MGYGKDPKFAVSMLLGWFLETWEVLVLTVPSKKV